MANRSNAAISLTGPRRRAALRGRRIRVAGYFILLVAAFTDPLPALADEQPSLLDEIVVTARKIEEPVQRLPMSVQVISADTLDDPGLSSPFELQYAVPGMVVNSAGGFGAGFALRGVTDQGGTSQSVATHLNGVYLGDNNLAIGRLFDMQRIEVLKGPQGTLYGRNSTGGSINLITRVPQNQFSAAFEAAYGSFDTLRAHGHVNLPLQSSALRLAFIASGGDGFIRNTADDRKFSENDFKGIRVSWRLTPNDKLQLDAVVQSVIDDGGSSDLWLPNPAFLPDPSDIHLTTVTLANPFLRIRNDNVSLDLRYDLDFAEFRSVSGYARNEVRNRDDCAGLPPLQGCIREILPRRHRQLSQEFHLVSPADAGIDWLLGAYFFEASSSANFFQLTPVLNPLPTFNSKSTTESGAYAVFGQLAMSIAEHWTVTGGLRLSYEDRVVSDIGTGTADNLTLTTAANDWGNVSWRFDVAYSASENILYYAGISTGFKSGGITTERLPDGEFDTFDAENLLAFEVGAKTSWPDQRFTFNAAAFLYDFDDLQISTTYFDGANVITDVDNAAKAEIYGVDATAKVALNDHWALDFALVWMPQREFKDLRSQPTSGSLSGNKVSRAPEWSATMSVGYHQALGRHGSLSGRLEYNYRTGYYFTKENDPLNAQGPFGLLNLLLRFDSGSEKWYLFASGRNLANEDYYNQVFIQSSPGYPDTYEAGFGLRF